MRKAFFCYELTNSSQWASVIYYDGLPSKPVGGKESATPRVGDYPIPPELIKNDEVIVPFSILEKLYPPPLTKGTFKPRVKKEKEAIVARPVQGFMTSQGNFFDTGEEADFYESAYELDVLITGAVVDLCKILDIENPDYHQGVKDGMLQFLEQNEHVICGYYNTKRDLAKQNEISKPLQLSTEAASADPRSGDTGDSTERPQPEVADEVLRVGNDDGSADGVGGSRVD